MKEKYGPCFEKKCSWCCNPVKVHRFFPESKIPTNKKGEKIWEPDGLLATECVDGEKLEAYKCKNYNKKTGLCKEYEDRPDICRNTSCVDEKSDESIDEQHNKMVKQKFIPIKLSQRK